MKTYLFVIQFETFVVAVACEKCKLNFLVGGFKSKPDNMYLFYYPTLICKGNNLFLLQPFAF